MNKKGKIITWSIVLVLVVAVVAVIATQLMNGGAKKIDRTHFQQLVENAQYFKEDGTPNEVKLKYLADNDFKDLSGEALKEAISNRIREKKDNLVGDMVSQGTTPRKLTDLIGSLCDLTSGSGDKGTPVVLIQGYFDNYTN